MEEKFKDISRYEGLYMISNYGRVLSCERQVWNGRVYYTIFDRYLRPALNNKGYEYVRLSKNGKVKNHTIHQLIAVAFLGHKPNGYELVVDHKDNNPLNNHVDNLQLITQRENTSKKSRGSSKYTGVSWDKNSNKWMSKIFVNGKREYLGVFKNEISASNTYRERLNQFQKRLD